MSELIEILNWCGEGFVRFASSMLVQSAVLIGVLFCVDMVIRKRVRAVLRYGIWMLLLVKLVLPTSFSLPTGVGNFYDLDVVQVSSEEAGVAEKALPRADENVRRVAQSALGNNEQEREVAAIRQEQAIIDRSVVVEAERGFISPVDKEVKPIVLQSEAVTSQAVVVQKDAVAASALSEKVWISWQAVVFLIWVVVVLGLCAVVLQRFLFVKGLLAQSSEASERLGKLIDEYGAEFGLKGKVKLRVSKNMLSPSVCGLSKPVILVPGAMLAKMSREQLRGVLFHEFSHIKRGDLWVNFAQTLLQIVYFYNPLLWFANAVIRGIREKAVDEMVLTKLGEGGSESYSKTLIDVAEIAFSRPHFSLRLVGVVESKKSLASRIRHILGRPFPKSARLGLVGLVVIFIAAIVLLPMAKGEPQIDFESFGITINRVNSDDNIDKNIEYSGGSELMRAYMEALLDGDEDTIANITSAGNERTKQLRLSFNDIDKLSTIHSDSSYSPFSRRKLAAGDPEINAKLGLFSGGRIKRIDGVTYHLIALITQKNNKTWQLKDARWYHIDEELQEAEKPLNHEMAQSIIAIAKILKPDEASSLNKAKIEKELNRQSKKMVEFLGKKEASGDVLYGKKVTAAKEDIIIAVQELVEALRTDDLDSKGIRCPGGLKYKLERVSELCDVEAIYIDQIYSNNSFAIALIKGVERHDGLPLQLGVSFIVYPNGKWVFRDTDWLRVETEAEFIAGFKRNYPNVKPVLSIEKTSSEQTQIQSSKMLYNTVVERELHASGLFENDLFDFRTNRVFEFPDVKFWDVPEWLKDNGIDIVCIKSKTGVTLTGNGRVNNNGGNICKFVATDAGMDCSYGALLKEWAEKESAEVIEHKDWDNLPGRFFFKSRDGDNGILEIVNIDDINQTLKFKYKLFESEEITLNSKLKTKNFRATLESLTESDVRESRRVRALVKSIEQDDDRQRGRAAKELTEAIKDGDITANSVGKVLQAIADRMNKHPKTMDRDRKFTSYPNIYWEEIGLGLELIVSEKAKYEDASQFLKALELVGCTYGIEHDGVFRLFGQLNITRDDIFVKYKLQNKKKDGKAAEHELFDVSSMERGGLSWGREVTKKLYPQESLDLELEVEWYQLGKSFAEELPVNFREKDEALKDLINRGIAKKLYQYTYELELTQNSKWQGIFSANKWSRGLGGPDSLAFGSKRARVVDSRGKGVSGAVIEFDKEAKVKDINGSAVTMHRLRGGRVITDSKGRFPMPAIDSIVSADGKVISFNAVITADGFIKRVVPFTMSRDYPQGKGEIDLFRPSTVRGRLIGRDGKEVANATLMLITKMSYTFPKCGVGSQLNASTDEQGRFEIENVPPGLHLLSYPNRNVSGKVANLPVDNICGALRLTVADGRDIDDVVVDLSKSTCVVTGRILDKKGLPIEGALANVIVELKIVREDGSYNGITTSFYSSKPTDINGTYVLNLPPGDWFIQASYPYIKGQKKKASSNIKIQLHPGLTRHLDITLARQDKNAGNEKFVAKVTDGISVKLVGVADIPAEGQWWAADGSVLENVYWDGTSDKNEETKEARQVILRINSKETAPDLKPTMNVSVRRESVPPGSWVGTFNVSKDNKTLEELCGYSFSLHDDNPTVDIDVTVSCGKWETLSAKNSDSYGDLTSTATSLGTLIINDPTEKDGKTAISATLMAQVEGWRIVAIDKQGKSHKGSLYSLSLKEDAAAKSPEHQVCKAEFSLPLNQIDKFLFQTRKTETVTFKNVSVSPGVNTYVQIKRSGLPIQFVGSDNEGDIARNHWRLDLTRPVRLAQHSFRIKGDVIAGYWGSLEGTLRDPSNGTNVDYQLIVAKEGEKLGYMTRKEQSREGLSGYDAIASSGRKLLDEPECDQTITYILKKPAELSEKYLPLWKRDYIKDGIVIETLLYGVRLRGENEDDSSAPTIEDIKNNTKDMVIINAEEGNHTELTSLDDVRDKGEGNSLDRKALKILFIGNSLTYCGELPTVVSQLSNSAGSAIKVEAEKCVMGGGRLFEHYEDGKALEAIREGGWDYVVLQERGPTSDEYIEKMKEYVPKFDEEIKKVGAETLLYLTWPSEQDPWKWPMMSNAQLEMGEQLDCVVVPAGFAWVKALKEIPGIDLYADDGVHQTDIGNYLTACVFYISLTGRHPEGLSNAGLENLDEEKRKSLWKIAWDTFKDKPLKSRFIIKEPGKQDEAIEVDGFKVNEAKYGGGEGTPENPYQIWTADQMNEIGLNLRDWDKHFILMKDIDLGKYTGKEFNTIGIGNSNDGNRNKPFLGVFDGNGHKIFNFTYNSKGQRCVGIFSYAGKISSDNQAIIKNLGLISPRIISEQGGSTGSLAGIMIGGKIINCYVEDAEIIVDNYSSVGGLVGEVYTATISDCHVSGNISGKTSVGGFAGIALPEASIINSFSTATVEGEQTVGGFISENQGIITKCYSSGSVKGKNEVGGFAGRAGEGCISNCYTTGDVEGKTQVGGLTGSVAQDLLISNCFACGKVIGDSRTGGLAGVAWWGPDTIQNCYWDIEKSGLLNLTSDEKIYDSCAGLTTDGMKKISSFAGWDFDNVWEINDSDIHPRLRAFSETIENNSVETKSVEGAVEWGEAVEGVQVSLRAVQREINNIFLSKFELNKDIGVILKAGTDQEPNVVTAEKIRFQKIGDIITAKLDIKWLSIADAKWQATLTLQSQNGKKLDRSDAFFDTNRIIKGVPFEHSEMLDFGFSLIADISKVKDFVITIKPVNNELEDNWGKAVEGVQVSLQAWESGWRVGEMPRFTAGIRNTGSKEWLVCQTDQLCKLVYDGESYRWSGEIIAPGSPLTAGREYKNIPVTLTENWQSIEDHKPLELKSGKHTVAIIFTVNPTWSDNFENPIYVKSNSVEIEIEILPGAESANGEVNDDHGFAIYRVIGHENVVSDGIYRIIGDENSLSYDKGLAKNGRKVMFSYTIKDADRFDAMRPENYPLEGLIVDEKPLVTDDDIISYDWAKHIIRLKPSVRERLPKPKSEGTPFVVTVNGERIYLGALWTDISSFIGNMPTILYEQRDYLAEDGLHYLPKDAIRIEGRTISREVKGTMKSLAVHTILKEGDKITRPQDDYRIRRALESAGKLLKQKSEEANRGQLYREQESFAEGLRFIGVPEEKIEGYVDNIEGEFASEKQLEFAAKAIESCEAGDVEAFKLLLCKSTLKNMEDPEHWSSQIAESVKKSTYLSRVKNTKFFATSIPFSVEESKAEGMTFPENPKEILRLYNYYEPKTMLIGGGFYLLEIDGEYKITESYMVDPNRGMESANSEKVTSGYIAELSNGVVVELVGICDHPKVGEDNGEWWRPDGSLLAVGPYDRFSSNNGGHEKGCEIVYRIESTEQTVHEIKSNNTMGNGGKTILSREKNLLPEYNDGKHYGTAIFFYENFNETDISIGVGLEKDFKTISSITNDVTISATSEGGVYIYPAVNSDGKTYVNADYTFEEGKRENYRMIAVDMNDNEIVMEQGRATEGKDSVHLQRIADIEPDEIKAIHFQTQPLEWVTFKNVSLSAGYETYVEIKAGST